MILGPFEASSFARTSKVGEIACNKRRKQKKDATLQNADRMFLSIANSMKVPP